MKYKEVLSAYSNLVKKTISIGTEYNCSFISILTLMNVADKKMDTQKQLVIFFSNIKNKKEQKDINSIKVKVSNSISELKENNLIELKNDLSDQRINRIILTKIGKEVVNVIKRGEYV